MNKQFLMPFLYVFESVSGVNWQLDVISDRVLGHFFICSFSFDFHGEIICWIRLAPLGKKKQRSGQIKISENLKLYIVLMCG